MLQIKCKDERTPSMMADEKRMTVLQQACLTAFAKSNIDETLIAGADPKVKEVIDKYTS
jgi:hypothetical protein